MGKADGGGGPGANLTYLTTDGRILSREYREGFVDRHFGGWLEIRGTGVAKAPLTSPHKL